MKKTFYKRCYSRLKRDVQLALYPAQSTKRIELYHPVRLTVLVISHEAFAGTKYVSQGSRKRWLRDFETGVQIALGEYPEAVS